MKYLMSAGEKLATGAVYADIAPGPRHRLGPSTA